MTRAILAAALALLAGCSAGATGGGGGEGAGEVRFAPEGTRLELANTVDGTRSGATITVGDASGTQGSYTGADGAIGTFYPGCWGCGGEMQIDRTVYDTLWPLAPGKAVTFLRTGPAGDAAEITIRVIGREKIEIAGTFHDTLVLATTVTGRGGEPWSAEMKTWWSEELGWPVRTQGSDSRGMTLESEVVRVAPPA